MRVLITGGSGFVGQRLCEKLLALGHAVQVVSRHPEKGRKTLPNACDIRRASWMPRAIVGRRTDCWQALERDAEKAPG